MMLKLKERLRRRLSLLPLHHIDTSIVLEPENTGDGKYCRKYLQLIGYKYRGVFSLPVLGEIFLKIVLLKTSTERYIALDVITNLINIRKIDFYTPSNIENLLSRIKSLDRRIKSVDAEIFACAVEHKVLVLVTLDEELIQNQKLENEFGIKIMHPRDLL